MLIKQTRTIILNLIIAGLLAIVSGCGWQSATQTGANHTRDDKPDSIRIEIENVHPGQAKPVVTLSIVALVQQFYATTIALPAMPQNQICTMELGPHYALTFLQGKRTLATVEARREGCHPVSIAGEAQERQATQDFWRQLDQAIQQGTPPAR